MMRKLLFIILFLFIRDAIGYDFKKLDSLIQSGISNKSYPGAQIIIGDNCKIIYEKSYGRFTYDNNSAEVRDVNIFDLASVTKVVATTSAIMILLDEGKIDLDDKVVKYIPEFDNNGKQEITIKNLLLHNSGLKAWIPFYKKCDTKEEALKIIFNTTPEYKRNTKFVYSDLNAILLGLIVERISGSALDDFCKYNIFEPLGMFNTCFNPLNKLLALPTENDTYWRSRQLQGEVHDESASILGGISGNAGLFSNAKDLYIFMKMMLNNGAYTNISQKDSRSEYLFKESTAKLFTTKYTGLDYLNTRALGWDTKPEETNYRPQCGELFSENSFGHTGYTGTSIWCDKDKNLIVIFLTNRIYPTRDNNEIREIRPEVHNQAVISIKNEELKIKN
jgi:CubicO group peptidase (beta-lactamase class C family)